MKQTGKAGRHLQCKELEALALRQRLEQELQYKEIEALLKRLEQELNKEKKILKVRTILEQKKKMDESQQRMAYLQRVLETGEATEDAYGLICDIENSARERIQNFIERAPKYDENPETLFEWSENLETHLFNDDWETIPNEYLKRMIVSSITGAARREIILLLQLGAAFEQCEAGVFFVEMNKRFSQQEYDESKRQEYLDKKQTEEEETRRAHVDNRKPKQEYLGRKQESSEDTKEYYVAKE